MEPAGSYVPVHKLFEDGYGEFIVSSEEEEEGAMDRVVAEGFVADDVSQGGEAPAGAADDFALGVGEVAPAAESPPAAQEAVVGAQDAGVTAHDVSMHPQAEM